MWVHKAKGTIYWSLFVSQFIPVVKYVLTVYSLAFIKRSVLIKREKLYSI